MATGDGLLARLIPAAPIALDAFVTLCDASQMLGNGIAEVTQRGSLQIRGLSPASAPVFARTVDALGLGSDDGPAILTAPLLGLDAGGGHADLLATATAAALRRDLADRADLASLAPKVSVLIDGGGPLHLDSVPADLRLRACSDTRFHLGIAGTAAASASLGWVEPRRATEVIAHILAMIASRGTDARARDFANDADLQALRASLAGALIDGPPPPPRPPAEPIGTHPLADGTVAVGIALAFGYAEAGRLKRLAHTAANCGAVSIRPAPGRALLIIGLSADAARDLAAAACAEGLIVQPDDPRRSIVACAGAPACRSAALATRQLAVDVAQAAKPFLDGSVAIHVSGCAKGCAHPSAAALTLVGPDRIVLHGRAGDAPHGTISPSAFIAGLRRLQPAPGVSLAAFARHPDCITQLGGVPT
jgi:precorrin-3B synthase